MPQTTGLFTIRADGSLMISTTQTQSYQTSRGLVMNADGSLFIFKKGGVTVPANTRTTDGFALAVATGALLTSNAKLAGAVTTTDGFSFNADGTLFISGTKQPGATSNSRLLTFNPDGSLFAY